VEGERPAGRGPPPHPAPIPSPLLEQGLGQGNIGDDDVAAHREKGGVGRGCRSRKRGQRARRADGDSRELRRQIDGCKEDLRRVSRRRSLGLASYRFRFARHTNSRLIRSSHRAVEN
jgi:hypothetical protein